uniref:Uncharacterized protein LOC111112018 n=1 Tax=Crassostrea virginica TaxID=6565 RepID=A0A8B8BNV4_CRAVI|nr:uncharacterized protein LOC111112018 [Crassostrea virginica]
MLSRLGLVFLFVVQTNSVSVLTDDKFQPSTILIRQLLNQETLIRMALDRKVNDLVKSMTEMKNKMVTTNEKLQDAKREIQINNQQLQDAKRESETNKQELQDAKREIVTINMQLQNTETKFETNNQKLQDAKREIQFNKQQLQDAKGEIETNNQHLQNATMEIAALRHENSALKAEWQIQSNVTALLSAVGFTTKLSGNYGSSSSIIRGHTILYNEGNAYNGTVFTCPSPGLYVFYVSVITKTTNSGIWIYKNSQQLTVAWFGGDPLWNSASVSAAMWLNIGDQVYLRPQSSTLNVDHNSVFTGVKIN